MEPNAPKRPSKMKAPASSSFADGAKAPWVLVLGNSESEISPNMQMAATALGTELANAGFNLATFGWDGADELTERSFEKGIGYQKASLGDRLVHFLDGSRNAKSSGGWDMRFTKEEDAVTAALGYADAVVAVNGGPWTFRFCLQAMESGLLVLPIDDSSDRKAAVGRDLLSMSYKLGNFPKFGLNEVDLKKMSAPVLESIPHLIGLLHRVFSERSIKPKPARELAMKDPEPTGPTSAEAEALRALLTDTPLLTLLISRAALAERSFLRWLQNPEPGQFLEAARVLGVKTVVELPALEARLAKEFPKFEPNALWRAWFEKNHAPRLCDTLMATQPKPRPSTNPILKYMASKAAGKLASIATEKLFEKLGEDAPEQISNPASIASPARKEASPFKESPASSSMKKKK